MISSQYMITGTLSKARYYLRSEGGFYLATGFINDAERFLERQQAETVANRENDMKTNGAKVWRGVTWKVEPVQVDVLTAQVV